MIRIHRDPRLGAAMSAAMAAVLAVSLAACSAAATPAPTVRIGPTSASTADAYAACPTAAPAHAAAGTTATATIETPKGTIVIKLEADLGPAAVGNFIALARCGYYDNVVFHRLVPDFVIQGGDGQYGKSPNVASTVGQGGPGYTIDDDPVTASYGRGVVAMARTPDPHSEGSQFFIVLGDGARPALASANTYAIMGNVTSGMDVVDAIAAMPNSGDPDNAALDPVPMTRVTITSP
jgi:peptidyl-prolyl cis-trans isomerase B (cyclophilin B)